MRKREIILDFTSLLDVILILLFLILCSMNASAEKDAEQLSKLSVENEALTEQTEALDKAAVKLENEKARLSSELKLLREETSELIKEADRLEEQNKELQQLADTSVASAQAANRLLEQLQTLSGLDAVDQKQYELFLAKLCRIELQCKAKIGSKQTSIAVLVDDEQQENLLVGQDGLPLSEVANVLRTYLDVAETELAVVSMVYDGADNIYQNVYDGLPRMILALSEEYRTKGITIWFETLDLEGIGKEHL